MTEGAREIIKPTKNIIPDGALHKNKNHLGEKNEELAGQITEKGIPVVSENSDGSIEQHAEIEVGEVVFTLEVTQTIENYWKEYNKTHDAQIAIECGKYVTKQLLHNTVDKAGVKNNITNENDTVKIELTNKPIVIDNIIIKKINNTTENGNDICKLNSKNINLPIYLRNKKEGDYIEVKGLNGKKKIKDVFIDECNKICPNAEVLANIVVDLCYTSNKNKTFAWDVAGEQIFNNVLKNNGYIMQYPIKDEHGDIEFCGKRFSLYTQQIGGDLDVDFEWREICKRFIWWQKPRC